jgi:hypothetical protein
MRRAGSLAVAAALLLGGCAPKPDDMSIADHLREARENELEAAEHEAEYDPNARASQPQGTVNIPDLFYGTEVYNPTEGQLAEAERLRDLAAAHRRAAAELAVYEEVHCARFPPATRIACPLLLGVTSAEDVPGGIRITFAPDIDRDALLDHIRCHIAFARSHHRWGMPGCPLYVEGVRAEPTEEGGILLSVTGGDDDDAEELRRRARVHMVEAEPDERTAARSPRE